jgi:type IV pilus assembly protein PilA
MTKLLKKRGFTLIELMIVVAIIGILAAIAIPNFIKFQARSKQGEAKSNLKALFTAERSYYQEKDAYSTSIRQIGFSPERGNRYLYTVGGFDCEDRTTAPATGSASNNCIQMDHFKYGGTAATAFPVATAPGFLVATGTTAPPAAPGGLGGTCPTCTFSGYAAGNVDTDTISDVWYIGSADSNNPLDASPVSAGQPANSTNDVESD